MTQRHDTPAGGLAQDQPLRLRLNDQVSLELPDTWANRRSAMIFLRCLRDAEGQPLLTSEGIAEPLGYADRRNVHN